MRQLLLAQSDMVALVYCIPLVGSTFKAKIFVLPFASVLVAMPCAWAQRLASINDLAACINEKLVNHGAVDMSVAVEQCMPQACKVTASMSQASAQPACSIASTQLPRIYLNCP